MAFRFLLLFLLCLSTSVRVGAPLVRREPEPRNGSSAGGSADAAIQVNFTLQRVFKSAGEFVEGDFCNEGLDRPNNVTLELFFRVRDSDGEAGEWQHLQTISSGRSNDICTVRYRDSSLLYSCVELLCNNTLQMEVCTVRTHIQ